MSDDREGFDWLGDGIAAVLRIGTVVSIATVALGYAIGLIGGLGDAERPLIELLGGGGAAAIVAMGLFGLTLLPLAVLAAASIGLWRSGERRRMLTAVAVLLLLVGSLVAAAVLAQAG